VFEALTIEGGVGVVVFEALTIEGVLGLWCISTFTLHEGPNLHI
jgi:hypothetical protein